MSAEEDTELRDLIIQTLENNGVIGKIKAELRASVFLALEEEGSFRDKIPLVNTKLMQFLSKPDGMLAVSLVREFLQFFNLNFTLAVFEPEIATSFDFLAKEEIREKLKLDKTEEDFPILNDLIRLNTRRESVDYKQAAEPSLNVENKAPENETKSLRLENNREAFSTYVNEKFAEINFENQTSKKVPEGGTGNTNDADDPFFDEPLPLEKRPFFSVGKDDDGQKDMTGTNSNNHSDFFGLKQESKGLEKSSLSSLKDLPSLNTKTNEISNWGLGESVKKKATPMDLDIHGGGEGEYDDEDFHSSGSGHSAKSSQNSVNAVGQPKTDGTDNQDNSEQSIEEEIEEDFSGGVDDLLNSSLSLEGDVTTDQTISQISLIRGSDYMEECKTLK